MRAAVAAALMAGAFPAWAADCPDNTQTGMNICAGAAYRAADTNLNTVYGEVLARLKADDAAISSALVAAQRSWIVFRDAQCRFMSSAVAGGSARPMVELQCLAAETEMRRAALARLLHCAQGDMGCPVP